MGKGVGSVGQSSGLRIRAPGERELSGTASVQPNRRRPVPSPASPSPVPLPPLRSPLQSLRREVRRHLPPAPLQLHQQFPPHPGQHKLLALTLGCFLGAPRCLLTPSAPAPPPRRPTTPIGGLSPHLAPAPSTAPLHAVLHLGLSRHTKLCCPHQVLPQTSASTMML